jgi:hypothetical protein
MTSVLEVATDGGAGATGAGTDDDPAGYGVTFQRHLLEDRFGDAVVPPPVRGPFRYVN